MKSILKREALGAYSPMNTFFPCCNIFLESTSSMVFDRVNRCVYAGISPRTNKASGLIFLKILYDLAIILPIVSPRLLLAAFKK